MLNTDSNKNIIDKYWILFLQYQLPRSTHRYWLMQSGVSYNWKKFPTCLPEFQRWNSLQDFTMWKCVFYWISKYLISEMPTAFHVEGLKNRIKKNIIFHFQNNFQHRIEPFFGFVIERSIKIKKMSLGLLANKKINI